MDGTFVYMHVQVGKCPRMYVKMWVCSSKAQKLIPHVKVTFMHYSEKPFGYRWPGLLSQMASAVEP